MTPDNSDNPSAPPVWRPRVLVLDDEWHTLNMVQTSLSDEFEISVASRAGDAVDLMTEKPFDVLVTDVRMPDMDGLTLVSELKERFPDTQYILMTAFSDIEDTISAIRLGVADYLRKPFTISEMRHALNRCLEDQRLRREVATLRAGDRGRMGSFIARDENMLKIWRLAETVAVTDATVLISGETGTGKGIVASSIHEVSPRKGHPYVEINCAAIPAALLESELFGHERGAFTGAVSRKIGRVEAAGRGTLLLDEIGEMPLEMQAKLLRFLQNLNFERVGGNEKLHAGLRIIAATNRDLRQAVEDGIFRQDLYYRLHVMHLHIPPLRNRPQDIPLLAETFLERFAIKYGRKAAGFSPQAYTQLVNHAWPGNVREMENAVERAVIMSRGSRVEKLELDSYDTQDWEDQPAAAVEAEAGLPDEGQPLSHFLAECERRYLHSMLQKTSGSVQDTAKSAGINPKTLYNKMSRHGLSKMDYRSGNIGEDKTSSRKET